MKRIILLLVFVLLSPFIMGQINGVSFKNAIPFDPFKYEVLMQLSDSSYVIPFEETVVGLKHCFDRAKEILEINKKDFYNPELSDELIDENVNINNYKDLDMSIWLGNSEIFRIWKFDKKISMTLVVKKNTRAIIFLIRQ